jgi:hypothetical protein
MSGPLAWRLSAFALTALIAAAPAAAEDPIRIGFDFSQTGPLAPNGKAGAPWR